MNNWLGRGIIFIVVGIGCILCLRYATGHFKSDRQLILLNRTRPDFHHFLDIEKQAPTAIPKNGLKEYFDYFHLVTEAMPDNSDGILMLGYLDQITGNELQARDSFKEAYRLDPQFFFTDYDLALAYFNQGDYVQSTDLLQQALSIPPQHTLQRMMNSIIYRQIFSSMNNNNDIIAGLHQAYNDAYVLLTESLAKQKGSPTENVPTQVSAHIM